MALTKVKAGNILLTTPAASSNDVTPATTAYVTTALANLADSAPSTLDTLNELAAALGDDANFSTTVTNSIAAKAPLASPTLTGNPKINVGTDKNIIFSGGIGEIGNVAGFQAINDAGSANTDFGIRATTIRFATGSSERMRIDSQGNIGIGLTPKTDWHTGYDAIQIGESSAFFANAAADEIFMVQNARYTSSGWKYNSSGTATLFDMQSGNTRWRRAASGSDDGTISWSDSMFIDTSGNVGVGTTSPAQKLHVSGGSGASTVVQFGESYDTYVKIKATNTASAMLNFMNSSDTVKYSLGYRNDSEAGPFRIRAAATLDAGGHKWDFDAAGAFHVIPNNTAALVNITASGTGNDATINMGTALNARGIYVDDSAVNTMKFYTGYGKGVANREIFMNNSGDLAIGATRKFYLDGEGDTYMSEYSANEVEITTGGGRRFALSGGNAYFSGSVNANHNFSDERLKENIVVIPNALEKVSSLRGITFTRKADGSVGTGLIAQELEKVLPEAVYESKTIESLDDPDAEEYKGIRYETTVGLLVEAIKEQQTRIETLEAEVTALKG